MAKRTGRRRGEPRNLDESERRFRLLVNNITDYALYMLDPQGHVTSWNAGGQSIKGYSADEILGQHFSRFYTENDRNNGRPARALETARTTGRYVEDGWRVRKDGSFFWASVVIDAIRDDRGKLIGFAKITRDITERREAQIALEKMERQLAEAQKMDALGQLTGGIAHDFNNLLMVVSGHVQAFKSVSDPKLKKAAQAIDLAAQRGASLTRQLLTFARRQRVSPEDIDVGERIGAIREVLRSGLGSGLNLLAEIEPDVWPVKVDPSDFEIALVNLVINARDAMPNGGAVTVSARNVQREDSDFVAVSVTDAGVGIPDDVRQRIFDPFFTTKPVGKGTGLGLSQVHGFVHQAHGRIAVDSRLGEGTTVTMYLPRSHARPAATRKSSETVAGNGTVLLVEDNPDVASASTELLKQLGYDVRWAPDAASALEQLEKNGIDIVFSDVVMPGEMDGIGLAQEIKRTWPSLPIVLATGYSQTADSHSDHPILRKPYQLHELSQALADVRKPNGS